MNKKMLKRIEYKPFLLPAFLIVWALSGISCGREKAIESYHPFPGGIWQRYDIVKFNISLEKTSKPVDVIFFVRTGPQFSQDHLPFNMVMNTPSGEERIMEYDMEITQGKEALKAGGQQETERTIVLKRGLLITGGGKLQLEIENLVPRMKLEGISGIGIRIVKGTE